MENEEKNNVFYENLPLEEALKEHASCFDEHGNMINRKNFLAVMGNKKLQHHIFSEENLNTKAKQDNNLMLKASAETFLNKAFPPSWYWAMPDYYYPGIYADNLQGEKPSAISSDSNEYLKVLETITRNEAVLNDCGWERKKYNLPEYFNTDFPNLKMVFSKDSNSLLLYRIDSETGKELSKVVIPFSLICGVFLKCREYEFDKPWQLRAHDYKDTAPDIFEEEHSIVRDPETHEIVDYGDWKPEEE